MKKARITTVVAIATQKAAVEALRSGLVQMPWGADSSLFGGWGVRI